MALNLRATSLGELPIQLDPAVRDFEQLREYCLELLARLTPEWTDFYPADPGVTLVETFAALTDMLMYHVDRIQNEAYLLPAQLQASIIDLMRVIDFSLSPGAAAEVLVVIETNTVGVVLPDGWYVESIPSPLTPSLRFELITGTTLPVPGTHVVTLTHGETVTLETLGTSSGEPHQQFELDRQPLALRADGGSPITLFVDATPWSLVDSFLGYEPDDEVYKYEIDEANVVRVVFSDGASGKIPPISATVSASYRVGGGALANSVGSGTLTQYQQVPGIVSVYNPANPGGGLDPMSGPEAKVLGPMSVRAGDRCVTLEDFEVAAVTASAGVVAATARRGRTMEPFTVEVYCAAEGANPVPPGSWVPELEFGTGTIGAVGRYLNERKMEPTRLEVKGPTVVRPFLKAEIWVLPNYLVGNVRVDTQASLASLFEEYLTSFGKGIPVSRIFQVIEGTRGVDYVNIDAFHRLPATTFVSGPSETAHNLATVGISSIRRQAVFDRYKIEWISAVQYRIHGDNYGYIVDESGVTRTFVENSTYTITHYTSPPVDTTANELPQFEIQVTTAISGDPSAGEIWGFTVDNWFGNISIEEHEIVVATVDAFGNLSASEFELTYQGGVGA